MRPSYSGYYNVSFLNDAFCVCGSRVDDCDCSVTVVQQKTNRHAYEITAADDDCAFSFDVDSGTVEELDATLGSACDVEGDGGEFFPVHFNASAVGLGGDELGAVYGVEAVDVFVGVDGGGDGVLDDVGGEGELDEDSVDFGVGVQFGDFREELRMEWGERERSELC